MRSARMEAFSDGVIAIIITIMVLDLHRPVGAGFDALVPLLPIFACYVLSFVNVGIFWNNHHHLLHTVERVTGAILWSNLHLLFWVSLLPFVTNWMGENPHAGAPAAAYGVVLLGAALAYYLLQSAIIRAQGEASLLRRALGRDMKGKISPALYLCAIACSWTSALLAQILYVVVALMWMCPDRRIERMLSASASVRSERSAP